MSRIADIVLIVSEVDEQNVQALSHWMSTAEAGDVRRDGPATESPAMPR